MSASANFQQYIFSVSISWWASKTTTDTYEALYSKQYFLVVVSDQLLEWKSIAWTDILVWEFTESFMLY